MIDSCIFCKIIAKQIPSSVVYETDDILVIKDLYPKAPIHYLIMPKEHYQDIQSIPDQDMYLASSMLAAAKKLSQELGGSGDFKLVVNSGAAAGQKVFHIHMHFLAGKQLGEL
jgi:histidine triad (HIT) family protein